LCVLDEIQNIMEEREKIADQYQRALRDLLNLIRYNPNASKNYSYFPVIFESEDVLLKVKSEMNKQGINPRRYFFPSLDTLPYVSSQNLRHISGDISKRIMCLPIYPGMKPHEVELVIKAIESGLATKNEISSYK